MKLRSIPYGYAVKNGENIKHRDESKIVQRIYNDYINGNSFKTIARVLTDEGVSFLPGRSDWNKNRIKRILEDIRYTGENTYPAIISMDVFQKVCEFIKSNHNHQNEKSMINYRLRCLVECHCGTKMSRRHDNRRKASLDYWTCLNPECKFVANINDETLLLEMMELLNRLITEPSLIRIDEPCDYEIPIEITRLKNEVSRQFDSIQLDKDDLKATIFALASEKYKHLDNPRHISHLLRAEFEKQTLLSHFSEELLKRTVKRIWIDSNSTPVLVLKNNQNIRKEFAHDNTNASRTD